jgi:hypothetical protein
METSNKLREGSSVNDKSEKKVLRRAICLNKKTSEKQKNSETLSSQ